MGSEISTIQSLKAVDAWIDVINANINGGVRTGFKSSRLKFAGSNVDIVRAGTGTSLPLQMPEAGLTTANTVIDFSQGAVTASTENAHLAIQGEGFFAVIDPGSVNANGTLKAATSSTRIMLTRDGEFRTNQNGLLVNSAGYMLISLCFTAAPPAPLNYSSATFGVASTCRAVYNNIDTTTNATVATNAVRLSDYIMSQVMPATTLCADGVTAVGNVFETLARVMGSKQNLQYSQFGSTVYDPKYVAATGNFDPTLNLAGSVATGAAPTVLTKSLEASNASMTQSVPELSLAQKLFSALTKVLQTKQTNVDGVLNLVR